MSDPVTLVIVGAAMFVGGKVGAKNGWFSEDFGKALQIGGAAIAIYNAPAAISGASELGGATAIEGAGANVAGAVPGAGAGPIAGVPMGATEGVGALTAEVGAPIAGAGSGPIAGVPLEGTTGLLETGDMAATSASNMNVPAGSAIEKEATDPNMWDKLLANENTPLAGAIVGGQALTGYMASKQAAAELEEDRDRYNRQARFGRANDGSRVDLDLNRSMAATTGLLTKDEQGYA